MIDGEMQGVHTRYGATAYLPFFTSALFHYLGPAAAVLLFSSLSVPGVAWMRIASAALILGALRVSCAKRVTRSAAVRPLRIAFGVTIAAMNLCFYLAIAHVPLGTVAAIEFAGPITLAAAGVRTVRNALALVSAAIGVCVLTDAHFGADLAWYGFAFANAALFALYIVLGHRVASGGFNDSIAGLADAMLIAFIAITPIGIWGALPAFHDARLFVWGIAVGLISSVIPYLCDQIAMMDLPRATFAILLSLLPFTAAVIGALVLRQIPSAVEIAGIACVAVGVGLHRSHDGI